MEKGHPALVWPRWEPNQSSLASGTGLLLMPLLVTSIEREYVCQAPVLVLVCISVYLFNLLKHHNVHQHIQGSEVSSSQHSCSSVSSVSPSHFTAEFICLCRGAGVKGKYLHVCTWGNDDQENHFILTLLPSLCSFETWFIFKTEQTPWEYGFIL